MTYTFGPVLRRGRSGAVVVGVYRSEATDTFPGFEFVLVGYAVLLPDGNVLSFGLDEYNVACAEADELNDVKQEQEPEPEPELPQPGI